MRLDDEICCCYHVSLRKLVRYAERERPARPSQLSNCLGAGTGCGWCIPVLKKIHELAVSGRLPPEAAETAEGLAGLPATPDEYAAQRAAYLESERKNEF